MNTSLNINQLLASVCFLLWSLMSYCQEKTYPIAEDVVSLSAIIDAAYDAISGSAGTARPVDRIASLYMPNGIISKNTITDGQYDREVMTIDEFQQRFPVTRENSFYEKEINREVRIFGTIATVWSTYEIRYSKNGPVEHRGINSIQLHYKDGRWWIISWSWDAENEHNPIPASFDMH